MTARYAIYYAPHPDSELWRFGTRWLGRDPIRDTELVQPRLPGIDQSRIRQVTESPRHYGFHATLKAPFVLAESKTRAELVAALEAFAGGQSEFEIAPLRLSDIDGFLALTLPREEPALREVADSCVREFDGFRAPPTQSELERRGPQTMTERQRGYLDAWGYPYVFDEFRFHMTLSCRLDPPERVSFQTKLEPLADASVELPVEVDALCLFEQPNRSTPFRLTGRFSFG